MPDEGPTKICVVCGEEKPADEFYRRADTMDGRSNRCRRCDNARPRQTRKRILRNRAKQRARQDLVDAHRAEFKVLFEQRLCEAYDEDEVLTASPDAQETVAKSETPRLRPGQRRADERVEDRVNQQWCEKCAEYHGRGHPPCLPPGPIQPRDGRVRLASGATLDPAALEEFNAGNQRAREAATHRGRT